MDDLLAMALRDPVAARRAADELLAADPDARSRSFAHQARGVVLREEGDFEAALAELRRALAAATASGDRDREADVRATYGGTLVIAGRTRPGLRQLDRATAQASAQARPTILVRRAWARRIAGEPRAALVDMESALPAIRAHGDTAWLARTLNNLGDLRLANGDTAGAESAFTEALAVYAKDGEESPEALLAHVNLALVAQAAGNLPRALDIYDRLRHAPALSPRTEHTVRWGRATAYLAAGLGSEAVSELGQAPSPGGADGPDLLLTQAQASLAAGDPVRARAIASDAARQFRRQGRHWFELHARSLQLRARYELGERRVLRKEAHAVALALHRETSDDAPAALVLAGRVAGAEDASGLLDVAASYRRHPNALVRSGAWLGRALERELAGERGGVLRACGRGLDAIEEFRRTMGSSELRALATTHGRELATLAVRHAADDPRTLLRWSERWRATALAQPPVTPDGDVSPALAALRDNGRRLAEARASGEPTEQLEAERRRLEREVRAEHHRRVSTGSTTGGGSTTDPGLRFGVGELVSTVGESAFVELVDVDGSLHALVVSAGRVRRRVVGPVEDAWKLAEMGRFALRRAARGRSYDPGDLGSRLQAALLGEAAALLPEGPVVVAPTVRLHGAPWALLPALAGRPFSVVPSGAQWLRAKRVRSGRRHPLVLISGPGLGTGGAEVPMLAKKRPEAALLRGKRATVEAALDALDGARLVHVAAHGHFRADSPLFSSLELADGPLTVHDLERLRKAPYRLVLSACESGVMAPVGAEELLGLAAALFSMGTAGLVSSIAEVNDAATAELMVSLHEELATGAGLADALLAVRRAADGPTAQATAAAFLALGV